MSLLSMVCHMKWRKMYKDEQEYFVESVGEQLLLILWTSLSTLFVVGIILAIAL
jgi:hypothetical protein